MPGADRSRIMGARAAGFVRRSVAALMGLALGVSMGPARAEAPTQQADELRSLLSRFGKRGSSLLAEGGGFVRGERGFTPKSPAAFGAWALPAAADEAIRGSGPNGAFELR